MGFEVEGYEEVNLVLPLSLSQPELVEILKKLIDVDGNLFLFENAVENVIKDEFNTEEKNHEG